MPTSAARELKDELLVIADSKWVLGHWYIKVLRNGRSLPDFNALSGMAQDTLGHTRLLFRFIEEELGEPEGRLEFGRRREEIHAQALLDNPPLDWADFVVCIHLAEAALWRLTETFRASSLPAVAHLVSQIGQESAFHLLYTKGWVKSLDPSDLPALAPALARRLPEAIAWFGPPAGSDALLEAGIRTAPVSAARDLFVSSDLPPLLELAPQAPSEPAWPDWDAARRRPAGTAVPAELWEFILPTNAEAVRARRTLVVSSNDNVLLSA